MKNFPQIVLFSQLIASCRLWFQMTPTMSGLLEAIGRVNNNGRSRGERLKKGERGSSERGSTRGKRERAQVEERAREAGEHSTSFYCVARAGAESTKQEPRPLSCCPLPQCKPVLMFSDSPHTQQWAPGLSALLPQRLLDVRTGAGPSPAHAPGDAYVVSLRDFTRTLKMETESSSVRAG